MCSRILFYFLVNVLLDKDAWLHHRTVMNIVPHLPSLSDPPLPFSLSPFWLGRVRSPRSFHRLSNQTQTSPGWTCTFRCLSLRELYKKLEQKKKKTNEEKNLVLVLSSRYPIQIWKDKLEQRERKHFMPCHLGKNYRGKRVGLGEICNNSNVTWRKRERERERNYVYGYTVGQGNFVFFGVVAYPYILQCQRDPVPFPPQGFLWPVPSLRF